MVDVTTIGDIKQDVFIDLGKRAKVGCQMNRAACMISLKYGEKIPVESAVSMAAGSALNIAIGIRRLGRKTGIISVVGNDSTATLAKDVLKKERVDHAHLLVRPSEQSSFSAVLNFEGESTILAAHYPHRFSLPKKMESRWVYMTEMGPRYRELFLSLAKRARDGEFFLGVNPGALQLEALDRSLFTLLRTAHLLILNKGEAERLALHEADDMTSLLRKLQRLGPKIVVITDGAHGAYGTMDGVVVHVPASPAKRVETTGAGDAFASGFLATHLAGVTLGEAMKAGARNAASVIEHVGPHTGLLTKL
jgi:ribokinase